MNHQNHDNYMQNVFTCVKGWKCKAFSLLMKVQQVPKY